MFLLYFLTVIFLVVVGWMIYYTIQQNPIRTSCPEDPSKKDPCKPNDPSRPNDPCKPNNPCKPMPNVCNRCGYPRMRCRCNRPCPSC